MRIFKIQAGISPIIFDLLILFIFCAVSYFILASTKSIGKGLTIFAVGFILWIFLPIGLLVAHDLWASRNMKAILKDRTIEFRWGLISKKVPYHEIVLVKKYDPIKEREISLSTRTFGIGLPGYRIGYFKLRNGKNAFLILTRKEKAIYIEKEDEAIIVSPQREEEFLKAVEGNLPQ